MVITKCEKVVIPKTLEGQKFADEYMRKLEEKQMNFISRAENSFSIIIESQYYEEVKNGNVN
jgi:ABC-type tungstate transport system permease subunit